MELINVPTEIQFEIMLNLNTRDLFSYCSVTPSLNNICEDNNFIHYYVMRKYGINIEKYHLSSKQALIEIEYLIEQAKTFEVEYEDSPWDPFDNPEDDRFVINPNIGDFMAEVVRTGNPELVKIILHHLIGNFNWPHDIGDIHWFSDADNLIDDLDIDQDTMIELHNILFLYYKPLELIQWLIENPGAVDFYVQQYIELSWLLLENKKRLPSEVVNKLWLILPKSKRYNRREPIDYYQYRIGQILSYQSNRRDLIQSYTDILNKTKQLIRKDLH